MLQAVQLPIRFTWMIQLTDIYTALNKLSRLKMNLAMSYALEDLCLARLLQFCPCEKGQLEHYKFRSCLYYDYTKAPR